MAETEIDELAPNAAPPEEGELDEENRLKPEFVRAVEDALEARDEGRVYELVEPLHPADIADLFELLDHDERAGLA
jgi:magnesium transporter